MNALRIAAEIKDLHSAVVRQGFKVETDLPLHAEKILALTSFNDREKQVLKGVVGFISGRNNAKVLAKESVKSVLSGLQAKLQ